MMRRKAPALAGLFVICLLFAICAKAAVGLPSNRLQVKEIPMNERVRASSWGAAAFIMRPGASGEYVLFAFSESNVSAEVRAGGEIIAQGNAPLRFDMRSGTSYEIRTQGGGAYTLEVMRAALGRSITNPMALSPQGELKRTITRAYDVHWYLYTATDDGAYVINVISAANNGVRAACAVYDEWGAQTGDQYGASDGFTAFITLRKGQSCLLRVCGEANDTGNYTITAESYINKRMPISIGLSAQSIALKQGEYTRVAAYVYPNNAIDSVAWRSSDERVATVSRQGDIAAVGAGECIVYAYAYGGLRASLRVNVSRPTLTGVEFTSDTLEIARGEGIYLNWEALPRVVTDFEVTFSCSDDNIVSVSADGFLDAISVGEAIVTIMTVEGGFSSELRVTVTEPKPIYRALLVGIAAYDDGRERMGSVNTTQGMLDALGNANMDGAPYLTDMQLDLTKDELELAINNAFNGAQDADVSLIYINCHGGALASIAWLEMRDGSKVSAIELERMLRNVKGRVVVILDCCNSGAFIGQSVVPDAFVTGMVNAFMQSGGGGAFASSKYKVLVSSSFDQNSYRVAGASGATESGMSTVFARALAEGLGWDLIKDKNTSLKADLDKNLKVTLQEAYTYAFRRTLYYLKTSTARQSVQVWPRGDSFVLVAR